MHHRTWIEIDRSAFNHNVQVVKSAAAPADLAVVVKSNAYGHGLLPIGTLCQENQHVAWLCTAFTSEAIALRAHHVTKPILVMTGADTPLEAIIPHNITLTLWDKETALTLEQVGAAHSHIFNVHIKVDTGLSRFGLFPDDVPAFLLWVALLPHIRVTGIYSHFIESHREGVITDKQRACFDALLDQLPYRGLQAHIANSAGAMRFAQNRYGMVRTGLAVYGSWSSAFIQNQAPNLSLRPIMEWKATIIQTKEVSAGATVGYEGTYTAKRATRIAFIPVGYSDGYSARLANVGMVRIHNVYAPLVGKVAMNVTTIDITDLPQATMGDEVTLIGPESHICPWAIAQTANIPNVREITTNISSTIPRRIVTH